jgi:hypothetical protein
MENQEVKASYIPFCQPYQDCCYVKGCPAQWGYSPSTKKEFFVRCDSTCK